MIENMKENRAEGDEEQTQGKERKVKKVKTLEGREGRILEWQSKSRKKRGLARRSDVSPTLASSKIRILSSQLVNRALVYHSPFHPWAFYPFTLVIYTFCVIQSVYSLASQKIYFPHVIFTFLFPNSPLLSSIFFI